jgi:hypothetical protein
MMYDYSEGSNPLRVQLQPNIEVQQDNLPIKYPYVPRICNNKGYFFIWYGDEISDPDLIKYSSACKNEEQWINCSEAWMIEKGVALIYPYDDEIIVGAVKTAGYMNTRTNPQLRKFIKSMWTDIITMFSDKTIICPAGSFFEHLHLTMNQKRIPHDAYHWKMMQQHQFKRDGILWIRTP